MVMQVRIQLDTGSDNALLHCHFVKDEYVCAYVSGLRFSKISIKVPSFVSWHAENG